MNQQELATRADDALREVLHATLYDGAPATVVKAPPGAGKTYLLETVASVAVLSEDMTIAVATQTNAQSFDLAMRLVTAFPSLPVVLHARADITLPPALQGRITHAVRTSDIPDRPAVVLANTAKWRYVTPSDLPRRFDLLVVDEAYQMTDTAYAQIAGLAEQHLLVGDPGQISPVVTVDTRAWRSDPCGPHQPAPAALLARRPDDVHVVELPATRRLGTDSTMFVQPAFYPELPFSSLRAPRRLSSGKESGRSGHILSGLGEREIVMAELPHAVTGPNDDDVADLLSELAAAATAAAVISARGDEPLAASDIAVACAHVSQVGQVQAALTRRDPSLNQVVVDTSERLQGREAELVLVWHPVSGRAEATDFAKDAGRLCVMLSRHRAGCVVVGRAGITQAVALSGAGRERVLGVAHDAALAGWRANLDIMQLLADEDRILRLPG
ncbi:AAA family ATPase [Rhodococcus hoagii]|nr:AAA family ATPase [Prescottella equi]NKS72241.1 AAA family ATPase [Prescottella equi]